MGRFNGHSALVTGGTRGIGKAVATRLAGGGAEVTVLSRRGRSLPPYGCRLVVYDLQSLATLGGGVHDIIPLLQPRRFDILINCAGIASPDEFRGISIAEWNRTMDVNLTAPFVLSQLLADDMIDKGWGRIINVSSIAGRMGGTLCGAHYSASKAGLIGLTKHLARELGPYNITTNCVCPGQTDTDMLKPFLADGGKEKIEANIPLGRIATPEEQAAVIVFLASEEASYINGAIIDVNGGQL